MPQNSSQPNRRASSARSGGSGRPARPGGGGQGSRGGTGRPSSRSGGAPRSSGGGGSSGGEQSRRFSSPQPVRRDRWRRNTSPGQARRHPLRDRSAQREPARAADRAAGERPRRDPRGHRARAPARPDGPARPARAHARTAPRHRAPRTDGASRPGGPEVGRTEVGRTEVGRRALGPAPDRRCPTPPPDRRGARHGTTGPGPTGRPVRSARRCPRKAAGWGNVARRGAHQVSRRGDEERAWDDSAENERRRGARRPKPAAQWTRDDGAKEWEDDDAPSRQGPAPERRGHGGRRDDRHHGRGDRVTREQARPAARDRHRNPQRRRRRHGPPP